MSSLLSTKSKEANRRRRITGAQMRYLKWLAFLSGLVCFVPDQIHTSSQGRETRALALSGSGELEGPASGWPSGAECVGPEDCASCRLDRSSNRIICVPNSRPLQARRPLRQRPQQQQQQQQRSSHQTGVQPEPHPLSSQNVPIIEYIQFVSADGGDQRRRPEPPASDGRSIDMLMRSLANVDVGDSWADVYQVDEAAEPASGRSRRASSSEPDDQPDQPDRPDWPAQGEPESGARSWEAPRGPQRSGLCLDGGEWCPRRRQPTGGPSGGRSLQRRTSKKPFRVSIEEAKRFVDAQHWISDLIGRRIPEAPLGLAGELAASLGAGQSADQINRRVAVRLQRSEAAANQSLAAADQLPSLGGRVDELGRELSGQEEESPLECNLRRFTFRATKSDGLGNKCSGLVVATICYGGCDTGEIADWLFPHKKSIHKTCTHGRRLRRKTLLSQCSSEQVEANLREYHYVDAGSCECRKCNPLDTNCLGSLTRPYLPNLSGSGDSTLAY